MSVVEELFGYLYENEGGSGKPVRRYTLHTSSGIKVQVTNYGATICDVIVPNKSGIEDHVVLGFDDFTGYLNFRFIGSTIGRIANRINKGKFTIDGSNYQLTINNDGNHLHGGINGWDTYLWKSVIAENKIVFTHLSEAGSEGYPGTIMAQVVYGLSEDGSLSIELQATTDKSTPINMTNHSYFNLAGHASGQNGLFEHQIQLFSDYYIPINEKGIPTGFIQPVDNSSFDLRDVKSMKDVIEQAPDQGFDHCFCVRNKERKELALAARVFHPLSGRFLEVYTTQPGIQFYTGNFLPTSSKKMVGKDGASYTYQGAFCCEPQNYPNAINEVSFPNSILKPGELYRHKIVYKFGTLLD